MIMSPCCAVLELKSLQKAMMLTPCWPSAGPTGGDGLALPAGSCNLTYPVIFLDMATYRGSTFLDGGEVELHARRPPEDGDLHLELLLVHLHVVDRAREVGEGAVEDAHLLAHLEREAGL